jgi:hypothetical protein
MNSFSKLLQVPYAFILMNYAVLAGLFFFAKGHQSFWESVRADAAPQGLRHT